MDPPPPLPPSQFSNALCPLHHPPSPGRTSRARAPLPSPSDAPSPTLPAFTVITKNRRPPARLTLPQPPRAQPLPDDHHPHPVNHKATTRAPSSRQTTPVATLQPGTRQTSAPPLVLTAAKRTLPTVSFTKRAATKGRHRQPLPQASKPANRPRLAPPEGANVLKCGKQARTSH